MAGMTRSLRSSSPRLADHTSPDDNGRSRGSGSSFDPFDPGGTYRTAANIGRLRSRFRFVGKVSDDDLDVFRFTSGSNAGLRLRIRNEGDRSIKVAFLTSSGRPLFRSGDRTYRRINPDRTLDIAYSFLPQGTYYIALKGQSGEQEYALRLDPQRRSSWDDDWNEDWDNGWNSGWNNGWSNGWNNGWNNGWSIQLGPGWGESDRRIAPVPRYDQNPPPINKPIKIDKPIKIVKDTTKGRAAE